MSEKNLISFDRILKMSKAERERMIDLIKVSNLSIREKEENIRRLSPKKEVRSELIVQINEGMADIDDLVMQ